MKNREKKILNLRIVTFLTVLIVTLLPLVTFNIFFVIQAKDYLNQYGTKDIESVRDEKIKSIKNFYEFIKLDINTFSNSRAMNYLNKNNSNESIDMSILKDVKYIENVYILDGNFNELYTFKSDKVNNDLSQIIKQTKFSRQYFVTDFYVKDEKGYQFIFYKIIKNGEVIGFTVFELNEMFFKDLLNNNKNIDVDIYNGNFTIVASTLKNKVNSTKIDQYTKKMLNGDTNTEKSDGVRVSYSFIDLEDNSLYISTSKNENEIYGPINNSIIYIFIFFVLCLVFAIVVAIKFTQYLENYIKKCILGDVSPKFHKIFNLIVPTVEDTIELINGSVAKLDELKEMQTKLLEEYTEIKDKEDKINEEIKNI
ncbi:permease [Clostridium gasigenes]|uniref:permease n=1 Tax=Clostridium gasigenes TaxID=94869 RepID=UPI001C0DD8CE|nr:permease [Clostridium gasigenes]MBU3107950.1 permease [Clostridium gasigenes]